MEETKPVRVQRKRTGGWKMPKNTVYVGRPGSWGNPYFAEPHRRAQEAVDLYRAYIEGSPLMQEAIKALKGKNLACWCKPGDPCHADVLLEYANK